ncbi:tRNA (guanosine(37)-N1)-methyltransferase TrmD [Corynebacterium heidelbergense]|uniref:tRNA (guanine-N(1)-)-methyltransferase n=1 Tax=Corynebacterium heidelbergense TaxID=2055947 RepID=A0A364VCV8_9CORY|nr:tRNA (guanosine(37)-N1)-methyltransferase TrmD [Corynebacterium heidelbergense]RAV34467.1 tRNA (guanosine(37)-N1)-methyltransferase TrmD [Corynebacterium heidelbergense]WCZ36775.1 tRNA (guanine-N(1)-)-methyltransferase [Corynebacterium heidelbergense]
MRLDIVSIFPEYFEPLRHALVGKALETGILDIRIHNLRSWAKDAHKSVDHTPYGGGPGMVMTPTVWGPALSDVATMAGPAGAQASLTTAAQHRLNVTATEGAGDDDRRCDDVANEIPTLIVPTPTGKLFTQAMAEEWSQRSRLVFACGRYEGIDQRVIEDAARTYRVQEVSIGDYVLIGGEVAVLVIAEAIVRLIPGVLGNQASHQEDSFQDGLLEGPSYTKPRSWRGLDVPEVLFSGNHAKVARWRREQSLRRTLANRPELIEILRRQGGLGADDEDFLKGIQGGPASNQN